MRTIIGVVFAVISVLFLLSAVVGVMKGDAPDKSHQLNVSYYIGTFLPFIITMIISAVFLQPKKKKEVKQPDSPEPTPRVVVQRVLGLFFGRENAIF